MAEPTAAPRVIIEFCPGCRWQARAAWMAQELLTSLGEALAEVALRPAAAGVFRIWLDDELLADRKRDGGFPELAQIKRAVRDRVSPEQHLGHTDR